VSFFNTRKSLLVAGFGSFPGQRVNPAEILTRRLERDKRIFALAGIDLHTAVLPVDRFALSPTLSRLFAETSPDAVLLLGVAARRKRLTIETLARNRASILKPDAAKQRPYCRFIVHGGPDVLRGADAAPRLVALARRNGLPAALSHNAGDYLCNESFYLSLLMDRRACFIHVPNWRGARLESAARVILSMAKHFALA
jgi:pyroglutamyl-peptidase